MKKNKKKQEQRDLLIAQSNNLVRARYNTSLWEKRLFIEMLQQIKEKDEEFKKTRFYYGDLLKTYNSTSNDDYRKISESAEALGRKVMFLKYVTEKGEKRKVSQPVVSVDMPEELEDGHTKYLELKFNDVLKPLLLQLSKNYFLYDKANIIGIRKKYTFDFYEIFKEAEWESKNKVLVKFGVKELRDLILVDIQGKPTNQYTRISDFERYVIKPTQEEMKKETDLRFSYDKKKKGNKVIEIWFTVYKNRDKKTIREQPKAIEIPQETPTPKTQPTAEAPAFDDPIHNDQAYQKLVDIGVSPPTAYNLVKKHNQSYILTSIRHAKQDSQTSPKNNFAGFVITCLKQGRYKGIEQKKQAKKTKEKARQKRQTAHYQILDIRNDFFEKKRQHIKKIRSQLDENTTAEIIQKAREEHKQAKDMTDKGIQEGMYFDFSIVSYFNEKGEFPTEFVSFDKYMQERWNMKVSNDNNDGWYEVVG